MEEVRTIAGSHILPEDTIPEHLTLHLAQSRVLLNLLKNELRPTTNLIERLAAFGLEAALETDIVNNLPLPRLVAAHRKGLLFLLPSAAAPERVVLPLEYTLMREIKRPPTTDLVSGLRILAVDHARLMARHLELEEQRRSSLLLADIFTHLLERAGEVAASLSEEEQDVLDSMLERGGVMDAGALHREHSLVPSSTASGPFRVADLFGTSGSRGKATPVQRLFRKGLLFASTDRDAPGGVVTRVFVPGELVTRVSREWADRKAEEESRARNMAVLEANPETYRAARPDIQADLRAFALAARAVGFGYIQAGEARRDHTEAIARLRPLNDRDQEMLALLGRILGVFSTAGGRLVLENGAGRILDEAPDTFLDRVVEAVTLETGQADPLRPRIRRLLLGVPGRFPNEWLRFSALPDLLGTDAEYRRTLNVHNLDRDTEEADLTDCLEELNAWGFCHLAGDPGRLTGVMFREREIRSAPEVPDQPFMIPPNLEVVVPLGAPFDLLDQLGCFADPRVLDVAAVYALSESSLLRGSSQGSPPEKARAFLARHCSHDLPPGVDQLFRDVAAREGEVRVWRVGGVLRCRDLDLAEAFQNHPEIGPMILTDLAPGVFALHPGVDLVSVEKMLRKHGLYASLK